jgi:signal peptidase II
VSPVHRSRLTIGLAILSVALVLDQLTKARVRSLLDLGESIHVGGPLFLTHVRNTGSVFGVGQGYVIVPTIATILILAAIPVLLRHLYVRYATVPTLFESACIGLIAGGAIGNLVDRITMAGVTDFLDVALTPSYHWPAFNVADMGIVGGTLLLLIAILRRDSRGATHDAAD